MQWLIKRYDVFISCLYRYQKLNMNINPYAPPQDEFSNQPTYFVVNIARASIAEIWRLTTHNLFMFFGVLCYKSLRLCYPQSYATAFEVLNFFDLGQLDEEIQTVLWPYLEIYKKREFKPLCYSEHPMIGIKLYRKCPSNHFIPRQ